MDLVKYGKYVIKKTHKKYALKEMSKVKIIDRKSEKSIKNEKDFLSELQNPFLVNMICSFQDNENLHLVRIYLQEEIYDITYVTRENFQKTKRNFL